MNWPGAFADRISIPAAFAHPLPEDISIADAVGIEPLALALHAMRAAAVTDGEQVTVIGCGAEGLLLVQALVARGARVTAADLRADRLDAARDLGADRLVLVSGDSPEGLATPVVFEAAGAAAALKLALNVAAPGGRVVALGLGTSAVQVVPVDFVRRGLTLVGSLIYDHPTDFQAAIEMVHRRHIQPSALVSTVVDGLEDLPSVLSSRATHDPGGKTVVEFRRHA